MEEPPMKRRGPYRKWTLDPSVPIPRTTRWEMQKKDQDNSSTFDDSTIDDQDSSNSSTFDDQDSSASDEGSEHSHGEDSDDTDCADSDGDSS